MSTPQPDFSADARRSKVGGVVVVTGYIGTDGKFTMHNSALDR
jgi:hypothetical protein